MAHNARIKVLFCKCYIFLLELTFIAHFMNKYNIPQTRRGIQYLRD